MKQTIELMADYQCWPLWWSGNHEPGNINPASLPLSNELISRLNAWAETNDAILNWDDPASSGFTSEEESLAFEKEGLALWVQLQAELGSQYEVQYYSLRRSKLLKSPDEVEL